jgi:hypothetical protein
LDEEVMSAAIDSGPSGIDRPFHPVNQQLPLSTVQLE